MSHLSWGLIAFALILGLLTSCAPAVPAPAPTQAPANAPTVGATSIAAPASAPTAAKAGDTAAVPAAKIKRGGVLREIIKPALDSLDPHLNTFRHMPAMSVLFDSLLNYKLVDPKAEKFDIAPGLAESYKVVDPKIIDFKIRKGVKAHDGSDFTAATAKWNIERAMNHPKSQIKETVAAIGTVEVVEDNTLRFNLKVPSAIVPIQMTSANTNVVDMISKDAFEKMGEEKFATNPVGTGPMKFKEWVRDQRLVVERFPGHWEMGEDGQPLPYLDGFVGQFIPDQAVAMVELRTGNMDVFTDLELKDVATVQASQDLMTEKVLADWIAYPGFYFSQKQSTTPFSSNQKLRQAAHYAIDRDSMAKALGFGMASPQYYNYWFPGMLGYDETLPRREFDLAKSKSLMAEAGFSNGADIEVTAINRPLDLRPLEVLQSMWGKVDIRLKISAVDRLVWIEAGKAGKVEALANQYKSRLDTGMSSAIRTGAGDNYIGYSNPEVDNLWRQSEGEYDVAKRTEIYKQVQRILFEDAFHVSAYKYPRVGGFSKKVKGYTGWFNTRYEWLDK